MLLIRFQPGRATAPAAVTLSCCTCKHRGRPCFGLLSFSIVVVAAVALGYPMAAAVSHGLDPALWPPVVMTPGQWFQSAGATYGLHNAAAYVHMASMRSPAFAGGGLIQVLTIVRSR